VTVATVDRRAFLQLVRVSNRLRRFKKLDVARVRSEMDPKGRAKFVCCHTGGDEEVTISVWAVPLKTGRWADLELAMWRSRLHELELVG